MTPKVSPDAMEGLLFPAFSRVDFECVFHNGFSSSDGSDSSSGSLFLVFPPNVALGRSAPLSLTPVVPFPTLTPVRESVLARAASIASPESTDPDGSKKGNTDDRIVQSVPGLTPHPPWEGSIHCLLASRCLLASPFRLFEP